MKRYVDAHFFSRTLSDGPRGLMDKASVFGTEDCRFESYRGHIDSHGNFCAQVRTRKALTIDTVSEWLRRWTRNPLGSARRGSNPLGVATLFADSVPIGSANQLPW